MLESAQKIASNVRFLPQTRRFVRDTLNEEQALRSIRERLERRERNLVERVRVGVFENPRSPYRKLLADAAVDRSRFERWVARRGVEETLEELRRRDVFVTHEEFKQLSDPRAEPPARFDRGVTFDNPEVTGTLSGRSSGSRSAGTPIGLDFDSMRAMSVAFLLRMKDYDATGAPFATYFPTFPSLAGIMLLLISTNADPVPHRAWFTPLDPSGVPWVYRAQTWGLLGALRLAGGTPPAPRYAPLADPEPVARWLGEALQRHGRATLAGYASACVRVAERARALGIDLHGAHFVLYGEPVTPAKDAAVRRSGAIPIVTYATTETGSIAGSCIHSRAPDDLHLYTDAHAVIRHRRDVPALGGEVRSFMITSLLRGSSKVLLNVETDDFGDFEDRPCSCLWGRLGMTRRVSNVRSFVKLTAEGMTYPGTLLVDVIEKELPERFGGSTLDWQLVEEEDPDGHTVLVLRASPSIGELDEEAVLALLEDRIRGGDRIRGFMRDVWREAGSLRLRRQEPVVTAAGKMFPLHSLR